MSERSRIELRIDRLVLDGVGVEPRHAAAVREAVTAELSRLLAAAPARSWQDRRLRRVSAPPVRLGAPGEVSGVARGVARSLYRAIAPVAGRVGNAGGPAPVTTPAPAAPVTGAPGGRP